VAVAAPEVLAVLILRNSLVMVVLDEVQQLPELGDSMVVAVVAAYTGQVQMQDLAEAALVVVATATALLQLTQEHKMVNLIPVGVVVLAEELAVNLVMAAVVEAEL
jgi:hypothetical protein